MRRSRCARHVLILAGVAAAIPAFAAPDVPKVVGKLPPLDTFSLANGLQVAFLRTDTAPVVSVQLWYHAGSKDEPRDHRGTAHMFEHLMFQGSAHARPGLHAQSIDWLGGLVNAATDEDATHFVDTVPAAYLDYAIQLEAERMRNLQITRPVVDEQRALVEAEIQQQEASPLGAGLARCLAAAYQKHPYAWTAAGNAKELAATTPDDLKKFYDAYYQPNNALLVVVGKVTAAEVKAAAEKWFGPVARAADPPRPAAASQEPPQTARRREVTAPGALGMTLIGWHTPAMKSGDRRDLYALQLAATLLGSGERARLKTRLKTPDPRTGRPIALDAGMDVFLREDPGLMIALGAYRDAADGDRVEAAILDEIAKLAARGPGADELRRIKNLVQTGAVFALESAQGMADAIGRSWILTGGFTAFANLDDFERVSPADIQRVVKQYLSADRATIVVIPPKAR